jgi:hypothetical protein
MGDYNERTRVASAPEAVENPAFRPGAPTSGTGRGTAEIWVGDLEGNGEKSEVGIHGLGAGMERVPDDLKTRIEQAMRRGYRIELRSERAGPPENLWRPGAIVLIIQPRQFRHGMDRERRGGKKPHQHAAGHWA